MNAFKKIFSEKFVLLICKILGYWNKYVTIIDTVIYRKTTTYNLIQIFI